MKKRTPKEIVKTFIKQRKQSCFGSLKQSDHNFGFPIDECLRCGVSRAYILDATTDQMLEKSLKKIK